MGQFSWLDCVTGEPIKNNITKDVFVLIPKEFGGGRIKETCYQGYGCFGGYDIYELVAEWNRESLNKEMLEPAPEKKDFMGLYSFEKDELRENGKTEEEISDMDEAKKEAKYQAALRRRAKEIWRLENFCQHRDELVPREVIREIGIDIACYDRQNKRLPYPIKITYNKNAKYEECNFSRSDPNQGW